MCLLVVVKDLTFYFFINTNQHLNYLLRRWSNQKRIIILFYTLILPLQRCFFYFHLYWWWKKPIILHYFAVLRDVTFNKLRGPTPNKKWWVYLVSSHMIRQTYQWGFCWNSILVSIYFYIFDMQICKISIPK